MPRHTTVGRFRDLYSRIPMALNILLEPNRTPYDVNFRLFGVPVRIHPIYWLMSAILTFPHQGTPVEMWPILMVIVFVSLMVHELGHVAAFRVFGARAGVILWGLGGLAVSTREMPRMHQRIIISLAGPFAGFALAAIVWLSDVMLHWRRTSDIADDVFFAVMFFNIAWGAANLLPVWPLDGGKVSEEICKHYRPYNGLILALKISFVVAVVYGIYGLLTEYRVIPYVVIVDPIFIPGGMFVTILFGMLAFSNFQMLQQINRHSRGGWGDDRMPWER